MERLKKYLAIFLSLMIAISSFAVTTFAIESDYNGAMDIVSDESYDTYVGEYDNPTYEDNYTDYYAPSDYDYSEECEYIKDEDYLEVEKSNEYSHYGIFTNELALLSTIVVTFNPNGGIIPEGHETRYTLPSGIVGVDRMPDAPHKEGHFFVGWTLDYNSHLSIPFTGNCIINESTNVYAIWGHRVSFEGNGVTLSTAGSQTSATSYIPRTVISGATLAQMTEPSVYDSWRIAVPNSPSRAGFDFIGWHAMTAEDYGALYDSNTPITRDVTLFARWGRSDVHTVTFDLQGGTLAANHVDTRETLHERSITYSSVHNAELNRGIPARYSAPILSTFVTDLPRPGVTLQGWYTEPNGQGELFTRPGITSIASESLVNLTTIHFPQGFANLNTVSESMTVYAHFVYRVWFNLNGGQYTPGGAMNASTFFRDVNEPCTINISGVGHNGINHAIGMPYQENIRRNGFQFAGWWNINIPTTTPIGSEPAHAYEFTGDTLVTGSRTVFARWIPNEHVTVTFELNGGQFTTGNPTDQRAVNLPAGSNIFNYQNATMPFNPIKEGYVFMGWYANDDRTETRFTHSIAVEDSVMVYAQWEPVVWIYLMPNGGELVGDIRRVPGVEGMTLTAINNLHSSTDAVTSSSWLGTSQAWLNVSRPGFILAHDINNQPIGWNTSPDGSGTPFGSNTVIRANENGVVIIYTQWAIPITFHNNHGNVVHGSNATVTRRVPEGHSFSNFREHANFRTLTYVNTGAHYRYPTLQNWTALPLVGFHFMGWNTCPDGTGEWFYHSTVPTEPMEVFAIWTDRILFFSGAAPSYVLDSHYSTIGLEVLPGRTLGEHGMPINPVWAGQNFRGWNTLSDGSGTEIGANVVVQLPFVVYAIWFADLVFDATGGQIPLAGAWLDTHTLYMMRSGGIIGTGAMPANPVRDNWSFVEWNTDIHGYRDTTGVVYTHDSTVSVSRNNNYNSSIFAQWSADVVFDLGGGYINGNSSSIVITVAENAVVTNIPVNPTHPIRTFSHWEMWDIALEEWVVFSPTEPITQGHTQVVARWHWAISVEFLLNYYPTDIRIFNEQAVYSGQSIVWTYVTGEYAPTRDGFTFVGWSLNRQSLVEFGEDEPITSSLRQYAIWDCNHDNICPDCEVCLDCSECECHVCVDFCEECGACLYCEECVCCERTNFCPDCGACLDCDKCECCIHDNICSDCGKCVDCDKCECCTHDNICPDCDVCLDCYDCKCEPNNGGNDGAGGGNSNVNDGNNDTDEDNNGTNGGEYISQPPTISPISPTPQPVEQPTQPPLSVQQHTQTEQHLYEPTSNYELQPIINAVEQLTNDDNGTITEYTPIPTENPARINPQTSDDFRLGSIVWAGIGLVLSLIALIILKNKRFDNA